MASSSACCAPGAWRTPGARRRGFCQPRRVRPTAVDDEVADLVRLNDAPHIVALTPWRISHQFTGYVVTNPMSMPTCMRNQNAAALTGR